MAKQTEYAILVEPLADADGGGWRPYQPCPVAWTTAKPARRRWRMSRTPSLNRRTQPANWDAMFQARPHWGNGVSARRAACTKS